MITWCSSESITVAVDNSVSNTSKCTDYQSGSPACPDLIFALNEWTNISLGNISEVTFNVYDFHQYAKKETIKKEYVIPSGTQFNIIGNLTSENVAVQCFDGITLSFGGMTKSSLYFKSINFIYCGSNLYPGLKFTNLSSIRFYNVMFLESSGVFINNINNINISNCSFILNYITPNAALQISYSEYSNAHIETITANIIDCHFVNNIEYTLYPAIEGTSGVISVAILSSSLQKFNVTIQSCHFNNNRMPLYASNAPMIYISKVTSCNITILIDSCHLHYNQFSIVTKITAINRGRLAVTFKNITFSNNIDPHGNYGILHAEVINPLLAEGEILEFRYQEVNFTVNNGTLLYINSNGYSSHILEECFFKKNQGIKDITNFLVYITGNEPSSASSDAAMLSTNIHIHNITSIENKIVNPTFTFGGINSPAIIFLRWVDLHGSSLYFTGTHDSVATFLSVATISGVFNGINVFQKNSAIYGGAIAIRDATTIGSRVDTYPNNISTTPDALLFFIENYADYGGALYIDSKSFVDSVSNDPGPCTGKLIFVNNTAKVAGYSIYSTISNLRDFSENCDIFVSPPNDHLQISTPPAQLTINQSVINLFPGKLIKLLEVTVTDGLKQPSSCKAQLKLTCNDTISASSCQYSNTSFQLTGPPSFFLYGIKTVVDTQFYIKVTDQPQNTTDLVLNVSCVETIVNLTVNIPLRLYDCRVGFKFDDDNETCTCRYIKDLLDSDFYCLQDSGIACIRKGYWVGPFEGDEYVALRCPFPLCRLSNKRDDQLCSDNNMLALPLSDIDDQCAFHRGGIRCSRCRSGFKFTFEGVKCASECKPLYSYLILVFAVCFQFLIFAFILAAIRLKLEIGSGFLYGPLLFLAIVSQLPYGYYSQFTVLKVIVSTFTSIFLLNLEIFGEIPWCFDLVNDPLFHQSFYYFGPILVWIMLLLLVFVARCCPKLLSKVQESPVQAICLLIILSFWSLANTSIQFLMPLKVGEQYRVKIQPEIVYFKSWHVVFVFIAILFIGVITLPFIGILVISNCPKLSNCFRLYRVKPLLDEFQSCYHDKYRWYGIIYYIAWILYLVLSEFALGEEMVIVLILSLHFVFQPYKKKLLNIVDMLLLLDLLFLNFLLGQEDNFSKKMTFKVILVYLMTVIPLAYISLGCVGIFITQCCCRTERARMKCEWLKMLFYRKQSDTIQVTRSEIQFDDEINEREPLIRFFQEEPENLS